MRSHPYTPPPPLPPLLDELADELAAILPNQSSSSTAAMARRHSDDISIELAALDHDTSRLIQPSTPRRVKRHHVRVQGKLVVVRSISTANLHAPIGTPTTPSPALPAGLGMGVGLARTASGERQLFESAVGGSTLSPGMRSRKGRRGQRGRRRSLDDGDGAVNSDDTETETEEEVRETVRRDRQLRGYGIGGAGNIRRPTDVANFSAKRSGSSTMFFSGVLPSSAPTTPISATTPDRRRWNIRDILGLADRKGKGRTAS